MAKSALLDLLEIRKTSITHSLTDNFKSRDASASKKNKTETKRAIFQRFKQNSSSSKDIIDPPVLKILTEIKDH